MYLMLHNFQIFLEVIRVLPVDAIDLHSKLSQGDLHRLEVAAQLLFFTSVFLLEEGLCHL
jgi:hypothetical protein